MNRNLLHASSPAPAVAGRCVGLYAALCIGFLGLPAVALAQSTPDVTMILTGSLAPSSDGKVTPTEGDTLSVVNQTTSATEATTTVGSGNYGIIISKPSSFNKTVLVFRLTRAGTVYKMLYTSGGEAAFAFNGAMLPSQTTLNLVASSIAVSTTNPTDPTDPTDPTTPTTPTTPATGVKGDIDKDGVAGDNDISMLKRAISGKIAIDATTMDINSDSVVNTRDLIELIKLVRSNALAAAKTAAK